MFEVYKIEKGKEGKDKREQGSKDKMDETWKEGSEWESGERRGAESVRRSDWPLSERKTKISRSR